MFLPFSSEDQILIPLLKDNEATSILFPISSIMSFIASTFGVVALDNQVDSNYRPEQLFRPWLIPQLAVSKPGGQGTASLLYPLTGWNSSTRYR